MQLFRLFHLKLLKHQSHLNWFKKLKIEHLMKIGSQTLSMIVWPEFIEKSEQLFTILVLLWLIWSRKWWISSVEWWFVCCLPFNGQSITFPTAQLHWLSLLHDLFSAQFPVACLLFVISYRHGVIYFIWNQFMIFARI